MIIHDYQCRECGKITELYVVSSNIPDVTPCPVCSGQAHKVFLPNQTHPIDAPWIAGVREVVDKKSDKPWVKEFLRHPTRANLKTYMDKEGLRHMDRAEPAFPVVDHKARKQREQKEMLRMYQERNAITIN